MTLVALVSLKGGTGKTTSAVSLASGLAHLDPTLVVDADPQGQVGFSFGMPVHSGLHDWLIGGKEIDACLIPGRPANLSILPGDSKSWIVEREHSNPQALARLVSALRSLKDVAHWVVADTAPGGLLQQAVIAAADIIVIPYRPEALVVDGVYASLELVKRLTDCNAIIVLPVAYDANRRIHRENLAAVMARLGDRIAVDEGGAVPNRIAVADAAEYGKTIFEHNARGIHEVRSAYSLLMGRVMALAGEAARSEADILEGAK